MKDFERTKPEGVGRGNAPRRFGNRAVVRDVLPPSPRHSPEPLAERRARPIPPPQPSLAGPRPIDESPPAPPPEPLRPPQPAPREPPLAAPSPRREVGEIIVEPALPTIRTWQPEHLRQRRRRVKILVLALGITAAAAFILPTAVFPTMTVSIHPRVHTVELKPVELIADPSIATPQAAKRNIPAITVTVEKRLQEEYESSGRELRQDRARGTVLISNEFSSSPQVLVANTRLQDSSGRIFRLREQVLVPGAAVSDGRVVPTSIAVEVVADAAGEEYNIGPTEFRIPGFRGTPKYQGFYAKSEQPFGGGFRGEARVITAGDLTPATEDLTRRLYEELEEELEEKVPSGSDFLVPTGAREIVITGLDHPQAGERYDRFPVTATARGRFLAVRRTHVAEVMATLALDEDLRLTARVPERQEGLTIGGTRLAADASAVSLPVSGSLRYWRALDTEEFTNTVRTSTLAKTAAYLRNQDEVESFRIMRFPPWLWFIPGREGGLSIRVETPT